MKNLFVPLLIVAVSAWAPAALGSAGCCGSAPETKPVHSCGSAGDPSQCGSHAAGGVAIPAASQAVLDAYFRVQKALALDSLEVFRESARKLEASLRQDTDDTFPAVLSQQTAALTKADDLTRAREAFKPVSETLLAHLKTLKLPASVYREAYCPMAKASWAQAGNTLMNPFMGKSMPHCGQFKS